jgi:hypothetical protein
MTEATFPFRGRRVAAIGGVLFGMVLVSVNLIALARGRRKGRGLPSLVGQLTGAGLGAYLMLAAFSGHRAAVRLTDEGVGVDFGLLWRGTLPYAAIRSTEEVPHRPWMGYGVRTDLRSWVALVLWGGRAAALVLDPPRRLPLLPLISLPHARQLRLGLEDDAAFRTALNIRLHAEPAGPDRAQ